MPTEKRISEGLALQTATNGDTELAEMIAVHCEVRICNPGDVLMEQGQLEDDVFFILRGTVKCVVDGNTVAERNAGQHVGEMAAIDPRAARSATVIATELTEVAVLAQQDLVDIASQKPILWRNFAQELARRARQSQPGNDPAEQRKRHLFYTFLGVFIATAALTLLGITKQVPIDDFYLKGLYSALILEIIGCVIALFRRGDFI